MELFMPRFAFWRFVATTTLVFPALGAVSPKLPIVFEPNAGRWNPEVKFTARTDDYRVLLTAHGAELRSSNSRTVSISLVNANPRPELSGSDPLRCRTNYFLGNRKENWLTGVENYERVRYRAVYPGIDMVYYGAGRELEYDFVVSPGADLSRIRLRFQGIGHMAVTPEGNLLVESSGARLIEKRPVVYQDQPGSTRREISGRFKVLGPTEVGFEVAAYDRMRPLTIDPALSYSTLLGSSGADSVTGVKVDKAGLVYVSGFMSNGDFAAAASAYQGPTSGTSAVFIAVLDPSKQGSDSLLYFTYIGGSGADVSNSMALDASGNIYLTGSTSSTDFPTVGASQSALAGGASIDAFALKFNYLAPGAAALVFSTYIGGSDIDIGYGIDLDQQGAMYITGSTLSSDFPVTSSAYAAVRFGNSDAFIVKVDPNSGSLAYASYLGAENDDAGRAIAVAPNGTVYLAGETDGTQFPQAGNQYQSTFLGGGDVFIAIMDLTQSKVGSLLYSTYFGGSKLDNVRKIALDPNGKLLLTGYTLSPDFPVTPGALQATMTGPANIFVTRLDLAAATSGTVLYSTYFGGSGGDVAYDITSDAAGAIYLTGYTLSIDFPVTPDAMQLQNGGGFNGFISKLNLASDKSSLLYSTYVGQDGINVGYGVAVSAAGAIYAGGQSAADNVTTTANAVQPDFAGGLSDGFFLVVR
jgi:hypothetical protein